MDLLKIFSPRPDTLPEFGVTKRQKAFYPAGKTPRGVDMFRIDWRALERNKYAPWGRGALT